jgi:hypothetical protein
LIDGGLQKLIQSIRGRAEYASIARAIRFLSASYYEASLETAYFMAFTAMETVIDACVTPEERILLSAAKWKKVQRELRTAIAKLDLGPVTAEMKSKIGELRRATLQSRVENACVRMTPKTDDLWPGQSVSQGIVTAARMRNELFHAALSADMNEMSANLVRVQTFTERLLLKKLQWADEQIWIWYDQDLKRINTP